MFSRTKYAVYHANILLGMKENVMHTREQKYIRCRNVESVKVLFPQYDLISFIHAVVVIQKYTHVIGFAWYSVY